ncbi:single-stranded-DNA-specific exonuclease RecJ [Syntrophobacter fumaroxidans]|uniref:Single-stranded-DNA-specific exonuclease RecJ n=1 Tax=Syntrophobacter fumaroxidans (strain DSM 10017 / MPOB) TaxID=335543 RepID=A0LQ39_SYNFM|nr:single-stranded-DNA-specific exonuclease RecJ [Syntrophobacter fumaroxidans]ABK19541.1 phosphoesterase, RecJ domain protein [Syntrophobacter fumaroxidans MPOB]
MIRPQWVISAQEKPESVRDVVRILLANRGAGPAFLDGTLKELETCLAIRGMDAGAELMAEHLAAGTRIVLVGDYDCDGITSLAQVSLFLREIGYGNFETVVPRRSEGYGIPERAILDHPDAGLYVAMDCGTLDRKAVGMARERGADCIVIDHHEVPDQGLAPATVLINPKHSECESTFKEFCSSGLTLLFLARLRRALRGFPKPALGGRFLILAAIATVADMVPLVEGNRILVRSGLNCANQVDYPPLDQLVQKAGLSGKSITAGHLGYYIGPRINAAGRMADARTAYELLVEDDPSAAARLAEQLNRYNTQRQNQEDAVVGEIRQRLADRKVFGRTLVMADAGWPAGIIGIVASRVQQEFHYGPVVVFSVDEAEGIARGSARSIPGFDIHSALASCDDVMLRWGGHKMAAGMTIALDRMDEFAHRFEESALHWPAHVFQPRGRVDAELDTGLISVDLYRELTKLEPHGLGNPTPTFASRGVRVQVKKTFGRDASHLRLQLDQRIGGVFWRGARHFRSAGLRDGETMDVVYQLDWDDYAGRPVMQVRDAGRLF